MGKVEKKCALNGTLLVKALLILEKVFNVALTNIKKDITLK